MSQTRETVFITSPLEMELVARIKASAPEGVAVVHEPNLLPPTRYVADHKGVEGFRRSQEREARWRECLAQATILLDFPMGESGAGGGLEYAPKVKWVQTTSSGVGKMIENFGLIDHPVLVTTAKGIHAVPLAEFVMMALLISTKRLDHLRAEQAAHRWERYCGTDLPGKTMTVVGAGQVGAEVGRLAKAFGMKVVSVVNRPAPERAAALHADQVLGPDRLGEAIAQADCIALCMPHTTQTQNMINADIIGRMKVDAVLVNIARGRVVDEKALIEALREERIAFAALDVAYVEPLPADSPLWDFENVLISPHSASTVSSENSKLADIFITNLKHFVAGEVGSMMNVLDKKRMY